MTTQGYVAFDLGAESGRAILATLTDERLRIEEIHRFANLPQQLPSGYHWNLLDLWSNLVEGLRRCGDRARQDNIEIVSLGVDTWGVDFGLVGKSGQLLGLPYCYRDESHSPQMDRAIEKVGRQRIYDATGIQFMPLNSLYQLMARYASEPWMVDQADRLLLIPDILHWFFSGEMCNEFTDASTTQMLDMQSGEWAAGLLKDLGLPTHMLKTTTPAGTPIGKLRADVAKEANVGAVPVIVPGTHDTASAVAAVPVDSSSQSWAYLSSGTWSLMGVEIDEPLISEQSLAMNFTNEGGVGGKIRLLKNIAGLWLVQECRRDLEKQGQKYDYAELTRLASEAEPFRTLVHTGYAPFVQPGDMLAKLGAYAEKTGQPKPTTPGQAVRACLESLALTYRETLDGLEKLVGRRIDILHIVGGGGQNQLLNQMTADALDRRVVVGPFEATAIGNALTQAMGAGNLDDLAAMRAVVRASFDPIDVEPGNASAFAEQVARFAGLAAEV